MTRNRRRFVRYFSITAPVAFAAYVLNVFSSMLIARQGADALAAANTYLSPAINLAAAVIAAALCRRYVFRSTLAWGVAIPVMAALEMLYDMVTGMLWQPVMQQIVNQAIERSAETLVGNVLANAAYAFNLVQFALWAVLSYLFQRFILYRESLDASLITNDEGV